MPRVEPKPLSTELYLHPSASCNLTFKTMSFCLAEVGLHLLYAGITYMYYQHQATNPLISNDKCMFVQRDGTVRGLPSFVIYREEREKTKPQSTRKVLNEGEKEGGRSGGEAGEAHRS